MGNSSKTKTVEVSDMNTGTRCGFGFIMLLAQVLLFGNLALVLYWVFQYRDGIAWQDNIQKEFNLHPVLMIGGFIFLMGQSILVFRGCRCCRKIYNKLWHTILHLLVMPAVAIGTVAVFDSHNLANPPIPNLYSLHSWLGLATLGLFALQFVVGFVTFLVLLCCDRATYRYRTLMAPVHAHFGLATFLLAIAACVTGLTEKAIFAIGKKYSELPEEAIVMNALGVSLVATGIVITYIVRNERYRRLVSTFVTEAL